jgi:hypothetical protein
MGDESESDDSNDSKEEKNVSDMAFPISMMSVGLSEIDCYTLNN